MGWKQKRDKQNKNRQKVQSKFKAKNKGKLGSGKGGLGGFSNIGQLTTAGLKNFLGIGNPDSNKAHRLKIGLQNNLDYSDMQEGPTIKINPKQWLAGFEKWSSKPGDLMPTVKTGWLQKNIPGWASGNWINHTLKSPKKLMPGDDGYTPTGTGSRTIDKDTAEYLNWIAKTNPTGMTVSDAKKLYKKQIDEGISLKDAMRFNKAETGSFYALIDDTEDNKNTTQSTADQLKSGKTTGDLLTVKNNNSTTNNTMALNQAEVNKLYNEMLGRNATFGDASDYDADYWVGKTADQVKSGIQGSSEYKNRAALVAGAGDAGISEADLDKMVLPGGWKTEHHTGYDSGAGDLFDFNKDNNWKSNIIGAGGDWAKNQNAINQILGATAANNYSTGVPGVTGSGPIDGSTLPITGDGDTSDPAGGGWTKFADADAFKKFLTGDQTEKSGGMDDFMKFMMLMSVMPRGGGGGGYGGSQYGYGGLNPGGVQAAYNPWESMQTGMDFFKHNFGSGATTGTISTGN